MVTVELPFIHKMINYMHQTLKQDYKGAQHPAHLAVYYTHTQCLPSLSRCQSLCQNGSFHQAWSESKWTVLQGYLTISINIRCHQTRHRWQFCLSARWWTELAHQVSNWNWINCCGTKLSISFCPRLAMAANLPSVLWHCWLGGRKGIRPVKTEWWGTGVAICLECG